MDDFFKIILVFASFAYYMYKYIGKKDIVSERKINTPKEMPHEKNFVEEIFEEITKTATPNKTKVKNQQDSYNEKNQNNDTPHHSQQVAKNEKKPTKHTKSPTKEQTESTETLNINLNEFDITKAVIYNEILNPKWKEI
jgi:cell division septation protein DedD